MVTVNVLLILLIFVYTGEKLKVQYKTNMCVKKFNFVPQNFLFLPQTIPQN